MTPLLRKLIFVVLVIVSSGSIARDIDIESDPEIDAVFEADKCKQVNGHNLRCVFYAKKPSTDAVRIYAYSIEMILWNKDKKIAAEFVPNGDLDSGESYKHLIRSNTPITRIVFRLRQSE